MNGSVLNATPEYDDCQRIGGGTSGIPLKQVIAAASFEFQKQNRASTNNLMDKPKKFYLTTPIYYANSRPHVGSAYTTIVCDVIARYKRMCGFDVAYLTGHRRAWREHRARRGEARRLRPQQLVDRNQKIFRELWKLLGITNTAFIRTTRGSSRAGGAELVRRTCERDKSPEPSQRAIYKAKYEGRYCIYDNLYVSDTPEPADCPICGRPAELISEENYFFRLSAYQAETAEAVREKPAFRSAGFRLNEVKSFVESGLKDVSISRKSIKWGIPWPDDPEHVFYVWYDALTSYMSGIGFAKRDPKDEREVRAFLARGRAHDRQGDYSLSRGLLAGVSDGGGAATAEADHRAWLAAVRAGEDEQVEGERGVSRADREGARE